MTQGDLTVSVKTTVIRRVVAGLVGLGAVLAVFSVASVASAIGTNDGCTVTDPVKVTADLRPVLSEDQAPAFVTFSFSQSGDRASGKPTFITNPTNGGQPYASYNAVGDFTGQTVTVTAELLDGQRIVIAHGCEPVASTTTTPPPTTTTTPPTTTTTTSEPSTTTTAPTTTATTNEPTSTTVPPTSTSSTTTVGGTATTLPTTGEPSSTSTVSGVSTLLPSSTSGSSLAYTGLGGAKDAVTMSVLLLAGGGLLVVASAVARTRTSSTRRH